MASKSNTFKEMTDDEIEEYIDLVPILENLHMDKDSFLHPIKGVKVEY